MWNRKKNVDERPSMAPKDLEESTFLSPESYLSTIVLKELFEAFLKNPLTYGVEMRKKYGADYERALKDAIETTKNELLAKQRLMVYHPERGVIDRTVDYFANKRRRRNPQA